MRASFHVLSAWDAFQVHIGFILRGRTIGTECTVITETDMMFTESCYANLIMLLPFSCHTTMTPQT